MPTLEAVSLWLHVAAGTVATVAGLGALVTTKGGRRHRQAGRTFLYSMAVVVATTFVLLAVAPTTFRQILALVAIFSGYLAFSGFRAISRKRPGDDAAPVDHVAAVAVIVACILLGAWGVRRLLDGLTFGVVMALFAGIGVAFGAMDLWLFRNESGEQWTVTHLQRMVGAVIATVSAVSAVNLTPWLGVLAWLWPTIVGVPLIAYWSNAYGSS